MDAFVGHAFCLRKSCARRQAPLIAALNYSGNRKLGYDDVFELTGNTLLSLKMELEEMNRNSNMCHPQAIGLLQIIEVALSGGKNIVISGDMYPELNRKT